jgi:non-specific serine/threonine protein kinase
VVVKVSTSLRNFPTATHRELRIYEHLAKIKSSHPGEALIRELFDSFELEGPSGKHQCLVQQPMHMTVLEMMGLNPEPFNLPLLKMTLTRILTALDFLHTEANIIHAGTHQPPSVANYSANPG